MVIIKCSSELNMSLIETQSIEVIHSETNFIDTAAVGSAAVTVTPDVLCAVFQQKWLTDW